MTWTNARTEKLKALLADGWSASQIAKGIGGVTRNAVIGKVRRLGLKFANEPTGGGGRRRRVEAANAAAPRAPANKAPGVVVDDAALAPAVALPPSPPRAGAPGAVSVLNARTCRWPIGAPLDEKFRFCCAEPLPDLPYCAGHCREAFDFAATARANGTKKSRLQRQLEKLED